VSTAFALLLVGVASWVVTFVAAIQFSRTYRRWQNATGRQFRWSDPAKAYEDAFGFFRGEGGTRSEADEYRRKGVRLAKIALASGTLFAGTILVALVVGCVTGELTCSKPEACAR